MPKSLCSHSEFMQINNAMDPVQQLQNLRLFMSKVV